MTLPDFALLHHILERCKRITNIVENITYEELLENPIYQDALSYSIQTIGEAVNNLSLEFQESHREIPFSKIVGMRNIFAHQYFAIDLSNIWKVSVQFVPILEEQVKHILKTEFSENSE